VTNGHTSAWGGLVSALQRHTVHSELARLPTQDRHILSLAYVHGHTNREIAAMLHVSVRTVGRRLSAALARLEDSALRAGAWISALAFAALAGYNRWVEGARSSRWPSTVALAAAGTATAVAVGVAVVSPTSTPATHAQAPATTSQVHISLPLGQVPSRIVSQVSPAVPVVETATSTKVKREAGQQGISLTPAARVCGGNPTTAPPPVPVGPRGVHPTGPPVTTPARGGCGHRH
jgi:hypothetical protein